MSNSQKYAKKQQGAALFIIFTVLIFSVLGVKIASELIPNYVSYVKAKSAVQEVVNDVNLNQQSSLLIRFEIEKKLKEREIIEPNIDNINIKRINDKLQADLKFEPQVHLFANISLLIAFEYSVESK